MLCTPQDFDCTMFGLSATEAIMIDPQQRLLLEAGAHLLAASPAHNAPTRQLLSATGVFVGTSTPDYADVKKTFTPIGVYSATGMIASATRCRGAVAYIISSLMVCYVSLFMKPALFSLIIDLFAALYNISLHFAL